MSDRPFESRRARFAGWQATAGLLGAGHGLPGLGVTLRDDSHGKPLGRLLVGHGRRIKHHELHLVEPAGLRVEAVNLGNTHGPPAAATFAQRRQFHVMLPRLRMSGGEHLVGVTGVTFPAGQRWHRQAVRTP
ncbi:MAG: hypothetical protein FWC46_03100, partial [Actinomycetia bacterium]|nr:hypothetical protein [Actinomycetes bacterium]